MPSPHDPDHPSSAGLAVDDAGEATGNATSAQEEDSVKASRRPTRFWLGLAALVLGLATLAIVFFFFSHWAPVVAAETIGAGVALLAICGLLLSGGWRAAPVSPTAPVDAATATAERPTEASPAATLETPAAPAIAATPEQTPEAAAPDKEPPEDSSAAAPEAAPARKSTRPQSSKPPQNGHAPAAEASLPAAPASDEAPVSKPPLTNLSQSYPRPVGGYALDTEAEDLSQLLGDVAEQTVIAIATKGQRGVERRERMASKIDGFSQEMSLDLNYAPVVAYLESISALLRAGKPIPASQPLVDPFDGLYGYVLTLIRRKTGKTHDE
jgi:type IV secretory pathway VirB10-like protein